MAQNERPQKRWHSKQFRYTIMPLIFTILIIVLINWPWSTTADSHSASPTAVVSQAATPTAPARSPILPATVLPSRVPTNTPRPTAAENAVITLLGPPPGSSAAAEGQVSFYWTYSEALQPGQQFVLLLHQDEVSWRAATINEPNLGDSFQLVLHLDDAAMLPGTAVWQLQLEWIDTQQPLLTSEERLLVLLTE